MTLAQATTAELVALVLFMVVVGIYIILLHLKIKRLNALIKELKPKVHIVTFTTDSEDAPVFYGIQIFSNGKFLMEAGTYHSDPAEGFLGKTEESAKRLAEKYGYVVVKL